MKHKSADELWLLLLWRLNEQLLTAENIWKLSDLTKISTPQAFLFFLLF